MPDILRKNRLVPVLSAFVRDHPCIVLFIVAFLIYNLNFRNINSADTLGASLLPFVILDTHALWLSVSSPLIQPENIVSFIQVGNNLYPAYPIVTPVLVTPLYIIPYLVMKVLHIPLDMSDSTCFLIVYVMEKIAASVITAAAVAVFYAGLKEIVRERIALITALVLAFGTCMWSINSQALWQHGMIALLFSILFYLVVRNERREEVWIPVLLGICSALLVFTRPADMFLALPVVVYAVFRKTRFFRTWIISAGIAALPFIIYNESVAGTIFGGYSSLLTEFSFGYQTLIHLAGILISPNRGLFVFTPIAILGILGFLRIRSRIKNPALQQVFYSFGIAFVLEVLVYSAFNCWWAGTTYGPRFFAGSLPMIFVLVGIYLDSVSGEKGDDRDKRPNTVKILCLLIGALILWSVFVQVVGAFYYPNGNWNDSPTSFSSGSFATADTSRLWNVTDNQIFRTFSAGPIIINPVSVIQNLQRKNDIVDPATDFSLRMGLDLQDGWGNLEYRDGLPVRSIAQYSSVSIQYMRYSLVENNCTLTLVASGRDAPKTLEIFVNKKYVGSYPVPVQNTEISLPISLKSSLRLGNNLLEFRVPENCTGPVGSGIEDTGCLDIRKITINRVA
ncbi:hypothetical protein [Methanoregula sp.]|uniref:hypothetical protein n=1 Tax=Methanoregula sp. TaxID=2052170 RepID=UPI0023695498|nr:hypothetical protein [Methanoregula sp.]MDD1687202.1 hypothetical protein [Methanoregula sp.]